MSAVAFTVIIPVYNRRRVVCDAVQSVLEQNMKDFEIVVVDDGSTDGSADLLRNRFGNKIQLLRQSNLGQNAARNLAIAQAHGEYIAFLDSDDLWFPWTLTVYQQVIEQSNHPAFVCAPEIPFDDATGPPGGSYCAPSWRYFRDYYAGAAQATSVGTPGVAVRADVLREAKGFEPLRINGMDPDLWLRLGSQQGFVLLHEPAAFARRYHADTVGSNTPRLYEGIEFLIAGEQSGRYPGGRARKKERLEIITRHVREAALRCCRHGRVDYGFALYLRTIIWHLRLRRLRFLAGFPVIASASVFGKDAPWGWTRVSGKRRKADRARNT